MNKSLFNDSLIRSITSIARYGIFLLLTTLFFAIVSCNGGAKHKMAASGNAILPSAKQLPPVVVLVPQTLQVVLDASTLQVSGNCTVENGTVVHLTGDDTQDFKCTEGTFSFLINKATSGTFSFSLIESSLTLKESDPVVLTWTKSSLVSPTPTPTATSVPTPSPTTTPTPTPVLPPPPAKPTVLSPLSPVVNNLSSLMISGSCVDGNTIDLRGDDSGSVICASNSFSVTTSKSADGVYNFSLTQTDPYGQISAAESFVWSRDTLAPVISTLILPFNSPFTSASPSLSVVVSCETGSTVNVLGSVVASPFMASGSCVNSQYQFTDSSVTADGTYEYQITQIDSAGNSSAAMNFTWIKDSSVPLSPTLLIAPVSPSNLSQITLSGNCTAGFNILLSGDANAGEVVGNSLSTTCGAGGDYSFVINKTVDGSFNFGVAQQNTVTSITSPAAYGSWTRDTLAPSVPTLSLPNTNPYTSGTGNLVGSVSCESGAIVTVTGTSVITPFSSTGLCNSSQYPFTDSSQASDGIYVYDIVQTDAAGNNSGVQTLTWHRRTTPPSAPSILVMPGSPSNANQVSVSGTCDSGNQITIGGDITAGMVIGNSLLTSCTAGNTYSFTVIFSADGTYNITTLQMNPAAGIPSANATAQWVRDTVAPSVPTLVSPANTPYISADPQLTVVVNCDPGSSVSVSGGLEGQPFSSSGSCSGVSQFQFIDNLQIADGTYTYSVTSSDDAGNTSAALDFSWTRNTTLPVISPASVTLNINSTQQFTVSGGISPYSFNVLSGSGSVNPSTGLFTSGSTPGTVQVSVTDSQGHSSTSAITVVAPLAIIPLNSSVVVGGSKLFSTTGGASPITFSVISGPGSINSSTGQYTATMTTGTAVIGATDSIGNSVQTNLTVLGQTVISPATVTTVVNNQIQFSAANGVSPYTYSATAGCGSIDSSGLYTAPASAGSCVVTVTDSVGVSASANVVVNPALAISPTSVTLAASGTQTFSGSGGLAPYTFSVQSGTGSINSSSGLYTAPAGGASEVVKITDSLGNTATATITVLNGVSISPTSFTMAVSNTKTFVASGGQAPYAFSILSGAGSINGSTGLYTAPASSGSAVVRVTDSLGGNATASITINPSLNIGVASFSMMAGATHNFSATGGVTPYVYSIISGGGSIDSASGLFTAAGTSGTTVVAVTDALANTSQATVTVLTQTMISPATVTTVVNNQIQFTASNGVSPYSYSTTGGCGSINSSGLYMAPATSGTCVVTVTDSAGISASSTVTINPALTISPAALTLSVNGVHFFSATGGLAPYSYSVVSGLGTIDSSAGIYTAPASPGSTVVRVTDTLGNTSSATLTVVGILSLSVDHALIALANSATFTAVGGFGGNIYSVASGSGSINASTGVFVPSAAGSVTVTVTDSNGGTASDTITVNSNLSVTPSTVSVALNQTQQISALNGVPPYTYVVSSGGGSVNSSGLFTAPGTVGTSIVTTTDSLSNSATTTVTITNALLLSPQSATVAVTNTLQMTAFGGTSPYTYSIQSGGGSVNASGLFTAPGTAGTTVVKVKDVNNNTSTSTVTINPAISISPTAINIVTSGQQAFSGSGGVPPYSFSIVSGGGSIDVNTGMFTAPSTASTVVTIKISDALGNNVSTTATTYAPLLISPSSQTPVVVGGSYQFTATGGFGTITFSTTSGTIDATGLYTAPGSGTTDIVVATDSLGNSVSVGINLYQPLTVTPTSGNVIVNGSFQVMASGGYGSITYNVQSGGGSVNSTSGQYTAPGTAGNAVVVASDSVGNTASSSILIYAGLTLSPAAVTLSVNRGLQFSAVGGTPPYTYSIASGSGAIDSSALFRASSTVGSTVVRVTDSLGVTATSSINIVGVTKLVSSPQGQHSCAIFTGGLLKCWGLNSSGQLGLNNTNNRGSATGATNGMGDNLPYVNLGTGVTVKDIALGSAHTCAILNDNSVQCWGVNTSGQLGTGTASTTPYGKGTATTGCSSTTLCSAAAAPKVNLGGKTALSIYAGASHTCAILNDNTTSCWGLNSSGQLAQNNTTTYGTAAGVMPTVPYNAGEYAVSLALGDAHTCAILNSGYARCWGSNSSGQLGLDSTVTYGNGTTTSGCTTTCAMSVLLNLASANGATYKGTINLGAGRTVTKISAGKTFNCALLDNGTVKCWGINTNGNLGQNSTATYGNATTTTVGCTSCSITVNAAITAAAVGEATSGATIVDLASGYLKPGATSTYQTCMVLSTGKVKCIGSNKYGQLGAGSFTTATTITAVGNTATAVTTASTSAPINGQSATASTAPYLSLFTSLGTTITATSVTGGGSSFCALMSNKEVKCWGYAASGQLGYENTTNLGTLSTQLGDSLLSVVFSGIR